MSYARTAARRPSLVVAAPALVLTLAGLLAGCGGGSEKGSGTGAGGGTSETTATSTPTPAAPAPLAVPVRIDGSSITTPDVSVEVQRGQAVRFELTATGSGELHVHSTPAQSFDYEAGTSTFTTKPFTIPGVVEVEEEQLGKTIVRITVR